MPTFPHFSKRRLGRRIALSVAAVFASATATITVLATPAFASTDTWNGTSSDNWNYAGNWSSGIPGAGAAVALNDTGTYVPSNYNISGTTNFASISIDETTQHLVMTSTSTDEPGLQSGGTLTDSSTSPFDTIATGLVLNGPATITDDSSNGLEFVTNPISGTGPITFNEEGSSEITLDYANTYSGATTVTGGEVSADNDGAIPSALIVNSSGEVLFGFPFECSCSVDSLAGDSTGLVKLNNSSSLTAGADNTSTTFAGVISEQNGTTGALTKVGTGTLTLSGTNTYTGATTVSAGTLNLTGSVGGQAAISGGTLTGTGTINGALSVSSGATVSPGGGTTPATLTATGAATLSSGSNYTPVLSALTGDKLVSSTGTTTITGSNLTPTLVGTPTLGQTYTILSANTLTGTFAGDPSGTVINATYGGDTYGLTVTYPSNTVLLTVSSLPSSSSSSSSSGTSTTTSLTSSLNPATAGQPVTFTATVSGQSPTGRVLFSDGSSLLGTTTLTDGSASFTTSSLSAGTHSIWADYEGDGNNSASQSNFLTETVNAAATTTTSPPTTSPPTTTTPTTTTPPQALVPSLTLDSTDGTFNGSTIKLSFSCARATCAGSDELVVTRHAGKHVTHPIVAEATFSVAANETQTVDLRVTEFGKTDLAKVKKTSHFRVMSESSVSGGDRSHVGVWLKR